MNDNSLALIRVASVSWRSKLGFISAIFLVIIGLVSTASCREPLRFASTGKQTALIELFTSEGCSSCPPAEAWIGKLLNDPGLWKDFVPVAFHVDYWDQLGWKDRFASAAFTQRQRAYAAAWKGESVYTPCFVVNGREWQQSAKAPRASEAGAGTLTVEEIADEKLVLAFSPGEKRNARWEAHVVLLGAGLASNVARGENAGRELRHEFVALSHESAPMRESGQIVRAEFLIPKSAQQDAPRLGLAAWVTLQGDLIPVQATGGWLPRSAP